MTFNGTFNGGGDAFVARVNAQGTALEYCGYMGGSGGDYGGGIAVDASGRAYVAGYTDSDESTFPVTGGPDLTSNGFRDAFVARVNAQGTSLDYCGFIGGFYSDYAFDIGVDSSGNTYVAGYTFSDESSFPVTGGPDLSFNGGYFDAFVARVNAQGTALDYCGFIGGMNHEYGYGIAVDGSGNAYIVGQTDSDESSFPVTAGPDLSFNGGPDVFVAKIGPMPPILTASGAVLSFSSGGTIDYAIDFPAVDAGASYNILLSAHGTGPTILNGLSIPLTQDALFQASLNGHVPSLMTGFQGTLDANGDASAQVAAPSPLFALPLKLAGHPVLIFLAAINGNFDLSSDPVTLRFTP